MTIRPIIFSVPMVRALLDGRKTMTRRPLKPQPQYSAGEWRVPWGKVTRVWQDGRNPGVIPGWLRFQAGDLLYVRERTHIDGRTANYAADMPPGLDLKGLGFGPAIHMPRWASRITLKVTGVKVERLQDISAIDATAEGVETWKSKNGRGWRNYLDADDPFDREDGGARLSFETLWQSIHGKDAWSANPWVVAISFEVIKANVDSIPSPKTKGE